MRGGMARKSEVFLSLTGNLMQDGGRDSIGAEPADGDVITVLDQSFDRFFDGGDFVHHGARFLPEKLSRLIRVRIGK